MTKLGSEPKEEKQQCNGKLWKLDWFDVGLVSDFFLAFIPLENVLALIGFIFYLSTPS